MDVELEELIPATSNPPGIKPGPSEASLHIEGESEGEDTSPNPGPSEACLHIEGESEGEDTPPSPKPDASEDEENSQEEESDSEESDNGASLRLEQDVIDAIKEGKQATVKEWLEKEETKVNEFRGGKQLSSWIPSRRFTFARGTALHWAAYYGQLEIAQLLIDNGADPYQRCRWQKTVLHWACQCSNRNEELIELLLTTSDKPAGEPRPAGERLVNLGDCDGWTPLHYACNKELLQQLLEAGADPTARTNEDKTPLDLLCVSEDSDEMFDLLDKDRLLPRMKKDPYLEEHVIEAIKNSKEKEFRQWLDREREEMNHYRGGGAGEVSGGTPLHWAAYYGSFNIAKLLIKKGADPRVLDATKQGVLHWACQSEEENEELVKFLLKKRQVDVNLADEVGFTALHYACLRGHREIAKQLLKAKADVTGSHTIEDEILVKLAYESGKRELIELVDPMLPKDDDPELINFTVEAIRNGQDDIVQQWLQKEPDLNRCRGGEVYSKSPYSFVFSFGTALHWAAFYGKIEIAKLLLDNGANPQVMDKDSGTVLHWACKSEEDNDEMVKLVLEKIADKDAERTRKVNATDRIGCTALHYACYMGHQKVAETLKKASADLDAKTSAGFTPLDFAFFEGGVNDLVNILDHDCQLYPRDDYPKLEEDIVEAIKRGDRDVVEEWLKRERHNVNRSRAQFGKTALHWAAYYGQQDIAEMLIDHGANPETRAKDSGTVLHWACAGEKANRELVRLLLNKGCITDVRDQEGNNPIHLATSKGHRGIVKELIEFRPNCLNHRAVDPRKSLMGWTLGPQTPLEIASFQGHNDVMKLLDKNGATWDPDTFKDAIERRNEHMVSDMLQSTQWPTLLRRRWRNTTPFRELIKKMPEIAKQVLDRCVVSDPSTQDPKYPSFEVVFDYSFVEDHRDGRARSSPEVEAEMKVYPGEKKEAHQFRFREIKEQPKKNFTTKYGPPFKKSNHPLAIMIQYKRLDLLTHPVISSLLHHKWFKFGLWAYLLNLLVYAIFLTFLTSFALNVLNPQSTTCMQVLGNPEIAVCEQIEGVNATEDFTAGNGSEAMQNVQNGTTGETNVTCVTCELSDTRLNFVFAAGVIIIVLAGLRLLLEVSQLCYQLKSYLSDWVNWIEISLYILSIIFVSVFRTPCLCPEGWQWQVGVMAVLLAWINLISICSKFPSIGIYVIMFVRIVGTFLKVSILSVLLVVTFGLTFYMIFSEPQFQRSSFSPPATAIVKIMSMTAGDFSFDTIFRRSPSGESEGAEEILFPSFSYILWIIFVILMPVLFTNLLVGLAVGDIREIEEEAKLKKLALQVELILTAEDLLRLTGSHKRFISGRKTVKPNFKISLLESLDDDEEEFNSCVSGCLRFIASIILGFQELKHQLWGGKKYTTLENLQEALKDSESKEEAQKEDSEPENQMEEYIEALGSIKQMMSQMTYRMEQMSERMEQMSERIEGLEELSGHLKRFEELISAQKQGVEGSVSKRESEVGGDSV